MDRDSFEKSMVVRNIKNDGLQRPDSGRGGPIDGFRYPGDFVARSMMCALPYDTPWQIGKLHA